MSALEATLEQPPPERRSGTRPPQPRVVGLRPTLGAALVALALVVILLPMASMSGASISGVGLRSGHDLATPAGPNRAGADSGVLVGPATAPSTSPQWHQLTNLSTAPSARDRFGMAYDRVHNETVLFGGYNPGSTAVIFNDTWVFKAGAWVHLAPRVAPAPRSGFVLAFDPGLRGIVLFGGEDFSIHYGDTWLFSGSTWTLLSTPSHPSARSQYAMAYDTADRALVLFGGTDGSRDLGDTWEYNATGWHALVTHPSPAGRQFSEMAYDWQDHESILTGGLNATRGPMNGTWAFHAGTWTKLAISPNPPSEVQSEATTLENGVALFFGGQSSGGNTFSNSTWLFHHGSWTHTGFAFVPSPRKAGGFAYDTESEYVLMFGGAGSGVWLGDTWEIY
jgi:hypothetical protein